MPIATNAPIIIIHTGRLEGKLNANNTPVRAAEPSIIVVCSRFKMYFVIAHSKKRHAATEASVTIRAPNPNAKNETSRAGMSAIRTPYMFFCTLSPLCMWGDKDMISLFAITIDNKVTVNYLLLIVHYFLVFRARIMAPTFPFPKRILSNIGRCEGQVN